MAVEYYSQTILSERMFVDFALPSYSFHRVFLYSAYEILARLLPLDIQNIQIYYRIRDIRRYLWTPKPWNMKGLGRRFPWLITPQKCRKRTFPMVSRCFLLYFGRASTTEPQVLG